MRPFDPRVLRLLPAARTPVAVLAVTGVAQGVTAVAQAFGVAALVVAVVQGRPVTGPAAVLAATLAVRAGLGAAAEAAAAWAGVRVSSGLRARLVTAWLGRGAEERPDASRALTLATQGATSIEPYVARFLPALVSAGVLPVLAIGTMAMLDWPSALIVVLTVPLLPVFAALIGRTTADATARRWRALSTLSGHFLDVVRGLPTLVSYGRAGVQAGTIETVSHQHRRATARTLRLAFLSSAALELLATISVALVAVSVGLRLASGSMALGTALTVILLAPECYWPIRRVGAEFHAAADGAQALGDALPELDGACPPAPAARPDVRARGLGYGHPGSGAAVLSGVDLDAGTGLTVVTGPSGVGKSTLLELLAGLRRPSEGTLEAPAAHLVTQQPFLAAGTVRDNLLLGAPPRADDAAAWAALRSVGLDGLVAGLPQGLGTQVGDDGFGLSAGQRARLALARAALSTQPLLLLDEPTAHLDEAAAALVHDLIRTLAESRVVVAVTHRPELLTWATQHVTLAAPALRGGARAEQVPA